jgi:sec-independent protein translocase protein TatC
MSVLVIAIISMMLTPADPTSMVLMMVPLVILYEVGIKLCAYRTVNTTPFSEAET